MKEKIFLKCPCATRTCPNWGKCKQCRAMMSAEGSAPVCEQIKNFKYLEETKK